MQLADLLDVDYKQWLEPPAAIRSCMEFACALTMPSGELKGKPYSPSRHPGQLLFLQAFDSGKYRNFVIGADAQSGKSWLLQVIAFYSTCEKKQDVLYGLPDMRFVSDVWMQKFKPAMENTWLEMYMPDVGTGSAGGTEIETVHLKNAGAINFHGAHARNKGGGNDGRSIPIIIDDELDSIPRDIINKNERRADSFFNQARTLRASTVKDDDNSNILSSIENSTGTRIAPQCPACKGFSPFEWETFAYDNTNDVTAESSARIACSLCGYKIDEKARQDALHSFREVHRGQYVDGYGNLIGPEPQSDTYGIYWICLDNPFKTLGKIAKLHRAAVASSELGNRQDLIDFYHDQLFRTAPKSEDGENMDRVRLAQRSAASTYPRASLPQETIFTTAAIDQQKRVLAWLIKAHDMEGRTWRVDWGFENICGARDEPTPNQRIEAFDRLAPKLEAGIRATVGGVIKPVLIGVDVADWPAEVAPWMRHRPGWLALHGSGSRQAGLRQRGNGKTKASMPGWYELRTQNAHGGEWDVLWLDSDQIKHEIVHSFSRPINTSGASMLPIGLAADSQYLRELTAEEWKTNPDTHKFGWVQIYRYNEAWDLDYYTQALGQYWRTEHPSYQPRASIPATGKRGHSTPQEDAWTSAMGDWA